MSTRQNKYNVGQSGVQINVLLYPIIKTLKVMLDAMTSMIQHHFDVGSFTSSESNITFVRQTVTNENAVFVRRV